jgi:hypothetical protein
MKYFAAYCVEQKMGDPHTPADAAIATHIARPSRSKMTERPPHPDAPIYCNLFGSAASSAATMLSFFGICIRLDPSILSAFGVPGALPPLSSSAASALG